MTCAYPVFMRRCLLAAFLILLLPVGSLARLTSTEQYMQKQGLVDIHTLDSTIKVNLMYAYGDNFTGKVLYTDIHRAYLHPKAAKALVDAQRFLRKEHPQWSLVIFDAARPMSVQQVMWNEVKRTPKRIYVSNPANGGGLHNYGLAVDVSICNAKGDTLSMGTKIDYMGSLAHITNEEQMMRAGKLTKTAIQNRKLLRRVMEAAGFRCLSTEWWHFNYVSRATARKYYKVIR